MAADEALDDLGVEGGSATRHPVDGVEELGNIANPVLQQVSDTRGVVAFPSVPAMDETSSSAIGPTPPEPSR